MITLPQLLSHKPDGLHKDAYAAGLDLFLGKIDLTDSCKCVLFLREQGYDRKDIDDHMQAAIDWINAAMGAVDVVY